MFMAAADSAKYGTAMHSPGWDVTELRLIRRHALQVKTAPLQVHSDPNASVLIDVICLPITIKDTLTPLKSRQSLL